MEFIMLLRWLVAACIFFAASPVAFVLAPFVSLFSVIEKDAYPTRFHHFLTRENSLDGDSRHRSCWKGKGAVITWLRRTTWQWKNPLNNFRCECLGVLVCPARARWRGDRYVECAKGTQGWQLAIDSTSNTFSFFLYVMYPFTRRGLRVCLGWDFRNGQRATILGRKTLMCSVNFLKKAR